MKFLSLFALTLSLNAMAATDCDRVLNDLIELGVTKGTAETLIGHYESRLKSFEVYQRMFDQYPHTQTLGAYDRPLLKEEVKEAQAAIKRLEVELYGVLQVEPRIKARAKERCR